MSESFEEQLSRVNLMAGGDPTWDLSPNDCLALGAVLDEISRLRAALDAISDIANDPAFGSDAMGWIASECRKAAEAAGGDPTDD